MMNNDEQQQALHSCRALDVVAIGPVARKAYAFVQRERCVYVRIYSMFEFTEELESGISLTQPLVCGVKSNITCLRSLSPLALIVDWWEIRSKLYSIGQPVNGNVETNCRNVSTRLYEMVQVLGEGQYGMVTKARKKGDGKPVTNKKICSMGRKYNEGFPVTTIRESGILISEKFAPSRASKS